MLNLTKKLILIFLSFFLFPPTILIIILRPFILIRFGNLEYKKIGHLALDTADTAIYLSKNIEKYSLNKRNNYKDINVSNFYLKNNLYLIN